MASLILYIDTVLGSNLNIGSLEIGCLGKFILLIKSTKFLFGFSRLKPRIDFEASVTLIGCK